MLTLTLLPMCEALRRKNLGFRDSGWHSIDCVQWSIALKRQWLQCLNALHFPFLKPLVYVSLFESSLSNYYFYFLLCIKLNLTIFLLLLLLMIWCIQHQLILHLSFLINIVRPSHSKSYGMQQTPNLMLQKSWPFFKWSTDHRL